MIHTPFTALFPKGAGRKAAHQGRGMIVLQLCAISILFSLSG